jgi:hypothetical protein
MEKKNTKQSDISRDFIRSVGCNLFLLPASLIVLSILVISGFMFFRIYVFGDFGEPFQDQSQLIALAIFAIAFLLLFRATWRNAVLFYSIATRYRTMRQEKSRIEHLIKSDVAQDNQNATLLQYTESTAYEELTNGKR